MLDKFHTAKQAEIEQLRALMRADALPAVFGGFKPSFSYMLRRADPIAVIAEYKRASPSRGDINTTLTPEEVAAAYKAGGASAISVLTEETYFKGNLNYLERMTTPGLPLLRKDFIFNPLQITLTAATPASALLLIVRMIGNDDALANLIAMTRDMGMEAVVEIFNRDDLRRARNAGAAIIQVNNRDLDTLVTDMTISAELAKERRPGELWICASGITVHADLPRAKEQGYDAVLVGTSLMQDGDPQGALRQLLTAEESP
ncbi:MAG: indole-3-glycerol-phosphate synthase [Desulfovibrionaceae bacterium]